MLCFIYLLYIILCISVCIVVVLHVYDYTVLYYTLLDHFVLCIIYYVIIIIHLYHYAILYDYVIILLNCALLL